MLVGIRKNAPQMVLKIDMAPLGRKRLEQAERGTKGSIEDVMLVLHNQSVREVPVLRFVRIMQSRKGDVKVVSMAQYVERMNRRRCPSQSGAKMFRKETRSRAF